MKVLVLAMSRILVVGSYDKLLINFRGALLQEMVGAGHEVFAAAPGFDDSIVKKLNEMGVEYVSVPIDRAGVNPIRDALSIVKIAKKIKTIKPDIVLSYNAKPVIYVSVSAKLAKVKNIYSIITGLGYGFIGKGYSRFLINFIMVKLYKIGLFFNNKVFFQNNDDLNLFVSLGILSSKDKAVLVAGSGVNVDYFTEKPLPESFSFMMISRLLVDKGVREYASAASIVKKKYPEIVFKLVGWLDVNPSAVSKKELDSWIESGDIIYLGRLEDVRPALESATVYVLPSYREGMPRTVLEAMAMGRPIITTDAPGCRETVVDGCNGYLVPVKDIPSLVGAMEKMINDYPGVIRMGAKSRDIAVDNFSVDKVNSAIMRTMGIC